MAIDFRLQGKDRSGYWTLFPRTNFSAIVGKKTETVYKKNSLQVDVPPPLDAKNIQTIPIVTDKKMPDSSFDVYLLSTGEQANKDYSTIDQIEISENQMTIIRLGDMPVGTIKLELLFYEKGSG